MFFFISKMINELEMIFSIPSFLLSGNNLNILLSTIVFVLWNQEEKILHRKMLCSTVWVVTYLTMHFKDTTRAFLPMAKQVNFFYFKIPKSVVYIHFINIDSFYYTLHYQIRAAYDMCFIKKN